VNPHSCDHAPDGKHGVSWDDWDRDDPDEGPWLCVFCRAAVDIDPDYYGRGFVLAMYGDYVIEEEPV
jgi:hypothetical protein